MLRHYGSFRAEDGVVKKDISNVSRKPKGHGWDCENIERALNKFTGDGILTVVRKDDAAILITA